MCKFSSRRGTIVVQSVDTCGLASPSSTTKTLRHFANSSGYPFNTYEYMLYSIKINVTIKYTKRKLEDNEVQAERGYLH